MFFEGFLQLRNRALLLFFRDKSLGRGAMVLRGGGVFFWRKHGAIEVVVLKTDVANRQWISSALLNTLSIRSIITGCSRASSRSFLRKNGGSIAPPSVR